MAAKDSQGLQAIVIVLTILVILLGAGLIFVNNAKKTAQARATKAETDRDSFQSANSKLQAEANNYKVAIGFEESDNYADIQTTIEEDLQQFGGHFEEESRAYRKILESNADELRNSARNEANAKSQVQQLSQQLNAIQAEADERVKVAQAELQKAKNDMAGEKSKFDAAYEAFKKEASKIQEQLTEQRDAYEQQIAKLNSQAGGLSTRVDDLQRANTLLKNQAPEPDPFAQPADGRITWVNQRFNKGWINLGSADGLRSQVTFSVYAPNELDATSAIKKGSVEVVQVLGPHLAEVRITEDSPTDPLVPGDQIYSQVWERGRQLGFAIAGQVDIDEDGRDDLELLQRIISANGGTIHAAPGQETEMNESTRFLILGDYPAGDAVNARELQAHWDDTAEKADDLNVETVDVAEFLKLMGWRLENKAIGLGAAAKPSDFPAGPRDYQSLRKKGTSTDAFRRRLPPTPY